MRAHEIIRKKGKIHHRQNADEFIHKSIEEIVDTYKHTNKKSSSDNTKKDSN